jgi:hypothetical protein
VGGVVGMMSVVGGVRCVAWVGLVGVNGVGT